MKALEGKVALVAGATRGAGRGIARALGEAGAIVYCSGRSTRRHPATKGRPETIDETAELIARDGGRAIAVRTDHRDVKQVRRLIARIRKEQGRLDVLVNDIWGGDAWLDWWWNEMKFWKIPLERGFDVIDTAFKTHVITAHEAIPLMLETKGPRLIAGITDGDGYYYRGQFYYDFVKTNVIRMAFALAYELRKQKIACVAITPGFLRSESMLDIMGVTEENWRDAAKKRPEWIESETPMLVGRAVAALAGDRHVMKKTGRVFNSAELAREYGFTDVDGRVPRIWEWIAEKMPQFPYKKCDEVFYEYWGGFGDGIDAEVKKIQKEVKASLSTGGLRSRAGKSIAATLNSLMDETRVDELIHNIRRIDHLLENAVETLLAITREVVPVNGKTPAMNFVPPYISEPSEWKPPHRRYRITQAMCCSTIQRLWLLHRRFRWLTKSQRELLQKLDENFPKMFVPKFTSNFGSDKEVLAYVAQLGSETFGAMNPLTASWVFWSLMYAGEQYAHKGIGFFSFFSMLWALNRPHADAATHGAGLEPWLPTAYITAKCLFPIEMIIGICRRRARRFGEIAAAVAELERLANEDSYRARWRFAFRLDELSSTLYETSVIAVDRKGFSDCAAALAELAGDLSSTETTKKTWVAAKRRIAKMLRDAGTVNRQIVADAASVVRKLLPRFIDILQNPARREQLLERCRQFRGAPDEQWPGLADAADDARNVCAAALEEYEQVTKSFRKVKASATADELVSALREVDRANSSVADTIEASIADAVQWCKSIVGKETARASARNDTEFDPAELVNAMAIAVRAARDLPSVEIRDAVTKALLGKRADGSWAAGRPFYIHNRVLGAWSTTSDLMWTLATAIASHPEVSEADQSFLDFIEWLQRTKTEVLWGPEKRRLTGWSSERFFQPKTIDIWATCGAINALLPIRTVLEYRLWEIAQDEFTIVESSRSLIDVDPVDLAKRHRDRLHRRILDIGRQTSGDAYEEASYAVILHGPPGTSKSTLAGTLPPLLWRTTQFAKKPEPVGDHPALVRITPADFMKGGEQNIDAQARMIFKILSNVRGVTIFFDELDDLLRRRRLTEDLTFIKLVTPAMLNRLQDLRDACPSQQICFVIGTNFVDKLDGALIRPGRIDMALDVPYPDRFSKRVIAEQKDVPPELIDTIADGPRFLPWQAFRSLCDTLRKKKPAPGSKELLEILNQFKAEAERAEFYYHDHSRWTEPNDRFVNEFINCLSLHNQEHEEEMRRLLTVLKRAEIKRDLGELEAILHAAAGRAQQLLQA